MELQRFAAPLGARVTGLDVRNIDEATWQQLNQWFCQHKVLVFPGQSLDANTQIQFAQRWGQLVRHPYAGMRDFPDVIELKNYGKGRDINQHWHSDMTYNQAPPKLTMLYAHATPEFGGDTAFANQELAYAGLSEGLRNVITNLKAVHSAQGLAKRYQADSEEAPTAEHPVVRSHDETGAKALYVCRAFTQGFVGWKKNESQALLNLLFEQSVRPEYQARHQWQAGDLVMWDNRSLLHYAVHDHGDEPRTIHRVQVAGPVPS